MTEHHIPAWVDMARLCKETCTCPNTVDNWVVKGVLPPPVKRGGKLMWKWSQVDAWLTDGGVKSPDAIAERIRDATRRESQESRAGN